MFILCARFCWILTLIRGMVKWVTSLGRVFIIRKKLTIPSPCVGKTKGGVVGKFRKKMNLEIVFLV